MANISTPAGVIKKVAEFKSGLTVDHAKAYQLIDLAEQIWIKSVGTEMQLAAWGAYKEAKGIMQ